MRERERERENRATTEQYHGPWWMSQKTNNQKPKNEGLPCHFCLFDKEDREKEKKKKCSTEMISFPFIQHKTTQNNMKRKRGKVGSESTLWRIYFIYSQYTCYTCPVKVAQGKPYVHPTFFFPRSTLCILDLLDIGHPEWCACLMLLSHVCIRVYICSQDVVECDACPSREAGWPHLHHVTDCVYCCGCCGWSPPSALSSWRCVCLDADAKMSGSWV